MTQTLNFVPRSQIAQGAFDFAEPAPVVLGAARAVATTPEVDQLLALDCVVAIGVSGGKDSQEAAIKTKAHLDAIGHRGPTILVHSDLGMVEWKDSLPICQELAAHLGLELVVVKRAAGGMLERWRSRWAANVKRYKSLACVQMILPWSTPSMRFCTSELKTAVIASNLKKRFRGRPILNVTGIRRQESATRAKMPVAKVMPQLSSRGAIGMQWNPIIDETLDEVLASIKAAGLRLHEAYTRYGASRVSCAACIMSTADDLRAATDCPDNHAVYVEMVRLEAQSGFSFQGGRWLADIAPHLLPPDLVAQVAHAKRVAAAREAIEARIPKHMRFKDGWPTAMPTREEAELLAGVRREVAALYAMEVEHTDADSVLARYAALMALARAKAGAAGAGLDDDEEAIASEDAEVCG